MRYATALFFVFTWIYAAPAFADERDTVLLNVTRCGAIADAHTWLDCYYGAAQPMRRQLGLPPAPDSQVRLSTGPSQPAERAAPAGPSSQLASVPPPRKNGFFSSLLGGTPVLTKVGVSAYSFDRHGIFTVTLTNGQVWQQQGDDNSFAQWHDPPGRYIVSITEGSMGSFNLEAVGDRRMYKVRRVR